MATAALPYEPDDDLAADDYINDALRTRRTEDWRLLCHPRYVLQTERVLLSTLDHVKRSIIQRKADFERLRDEHFKHGGLDEQYEQARRDWQHWQGRTEHFAATVRQYLRMVADMARPIRGDQRAHELLTTLTALASAVHRHRASTLLEMIEPTPADRALWVRLDTLRARADELADPVTLAELITPEQSEDLSRPVSNTRMLCARLLLELSAGDTPVPRLELSQLWKQRAAFLDDSEESNGGQGSHSGEVLGQLLRKLDREKIIRRVTHGTVQTIEILDTDRLRRLAYPD